MPGSARDVTELIIEAARVHGCRLFRNNTGKVVHRYKSKTGQMRNRVIKFGIGPDGGGGGDLIGWDSTGRFVSIDVKYDGSTLTPGQQEWMSWVRDGGGKAGTAHSVEEAIHVIKGP